MLKALELVGFKSFADRTRFDFPDGITVVVGPNGSGKSNVVDAVKWVLGAQSAKALRGADMADVIFKGSAEGGRKPANSAEVVLVLDNTKKIFHHDADEVHVTRRVFRSGDGEYAINGQPCRLKDVKDLFRGTGVGVDAYSLIEQGKVDRLLQASAKDRRGIFEEAAGISRFKAKKVEAERRLQRVDQNLLRLGDIVDEVGKRLSTLKSQATKAQRYREVTQQLATKRTELGWLELELLHRQRLVLDKQIVEANANGQEIQERLKSLEDVANREKATLQQLHKSVEEVQSRYLEIQRNAIAAESGLKNALQRAEELSLEQSVIEERLVVLQQKASLSEDESESRRKELEQIADEQKQAKELLSAKETALAEAQAQIAEISAAMDEETRSHSEILESIHQAKSRIVAYQFHIEQLQNSIEEWNTQAIAARKELGNCDLEAQQSIDNGKIAKTRAEEAKQVRSDAELRLQNDRQRIFERQEQLAAAQGKLHGVRERLHVLEQLEDQFAGAGRGGQQLLRLARANQTMDSGDASNPLAIVSNPWQTVRGLVADILSSEMHLAPLIDVALGHLADAIVLSNGQIVDWIHEGNLTVDGRVTLLRLDRLPNRRTGEKIQLDGLRGVIGRADRLTQFAPEYEPLIRALLGTTWFVDSLATALELSHFRGAGLRFVTAECQLVDSDGSITLGSLQAGLGLISRRTEMQTAREEIKHLELRLAESTAAYNAFQLQIQNDELAIKQYETEERVASQAYSRIEIQLESISKRRKQLADRVQEIDLQIQNATEKILDTERLCAQTQSEIEDAESARSLRERAVEEWRGKWTELQQDLQNKQNDASDQRVALARLEQRYDGLKLTLQQLQSDSDERAKSVVQAQSSLAAIQSKIQASHTLAKECELLLEQSRLAVAQIEEQRNEQSQSLENQNGIANQAIRQCDNARRQLEKNEDKVQNLQVSLTTLEQQLEQVVHHYASEYQISLHADGPTSHQVSEHANDLSGEESSNWLAEFKAKLNETSRTEELQTMRSRTEADVSSLRQELAATGSVNMEALDELDDLQSRYDRLAGHQNDLIQAKEGLIKTMSKIDEDSRHLFLETLHSIRKNFQELYRRSFGGGFADIVMEDENDPDSGIEIVATPPGKTTLSNSLLSGGEKALTAVALIMSFFQYRPSPFCILDEVDAPFDEANIGRFVTVLREFLDSTKFIVVTHSKKTMTAANMIYGVTMQESGVSRQVSVRFEEVNDKGEVQASDRKRAA